MFHDVTKNGEIPKPSWITNLYMVAMAIGNGPCTNRNLYIPYYCLWMTLVPPPYFPFGHALGFCIIIWIVDDTSFSRNAGNAEVNRWRGDQRKQ